MRLWDDVQSTFTQVGSKTIQKGRELQDEARCKQQINKLDNQIEDYFYQIGRKYAMAHPQDYEDLVKDEMNGIYKAQLEIIELENQIDRLNGLKTCPACHQKVAIDAVFCNHCGTRVEKEVAENIRTCATCGSVVSEDAVFCAKCGSKLEEKIVCKTCSQPLKPDSIFCETCGTKVE